MASQDGGKWTWWCGWCAICWPYETAHYSTCPICNMKCDQEKDYSPLTSNEAKRLIAEHHEKAKKREDFERRYADREVARFRQEMKAAGY